MMHWSHVTNTVFDQAFASISDLTSSLQNTLSAFLCFLCISATASNFSSCSQVLLDWNIPSIDQQFTHNKPNWGILVLRSHLSSVTSLAKMVHLYEIWSELSSNIRLSPWSLWMVVMTSASAAQGWGVSSASDSMFSRCFARTAFFFLLYHCLQHLPVARVRDQDHENERSACPAFYF